MSSSRHLYVLLTLAALVGTRAGAQVFASEHAIAAQTFNGTTVTVEYYRPSARGRELFGKLVPWGRPWTPGANWATTIEVDRDVTLEGQPLPKGKYSVWAFPDSASWSIAFSRRARAFHTRPPEASEEQLRVAVRPTTGPHVEMLTWSFPSVTKTGAELHLQWGTTDVPLHLGVVSSDVAMTAADRARYVGRYAVTYRNPRAPSGATAFVVFDSADVLRLRREGGGRGGPYDPQFDLHPQPTGDFAAVMYQNGVLFGVEPAITIHFVMDGARASELQFLFASNGEISFRAVRDSR